jgi:hypothetical protein
MKDYNNKSLPVLKQGSCDYKKQVRLSIENQQYIVTLRKSLGL